LHDVTAAERYQVVFQPSGARGMVRAGTSIRSAAAELGVEIASICADAATCGKCRVLIEDGRFGDLDSSPGHASVKQSNEEEWLTKRTETWLKMGLDPDRLRLSCQAAVHGDMVVFVPESSRGNRQIIRKAATDRIIEIRPALRRYYLELDPATLESPLSDLERLSESLVAAMSRVHTGSLRHLPDPGDIQFDLHLLRTVGDILRAAD